jgi:hypothetical protein
MLFFRFVSEHRSWKLALAIGYDGFRSNRQDVGGWEGIGCPFTTAEELGFEPKSVVFRWHLTRIGFTSQTMEIPRIKGKRRFEYILGMLRPHGQYCPQFAPIWGLAREPGLPMLSC